VVERCQITIHVVKLFISSLISGYEPYRAAVAGGRDVGPPARSTRPTCWPERPRSCPMGVDRLARADDLVDVAPSQPTIASTARSWIRPVTTQAPGGFLKTLLYISKSQ